MKQKCICSINMTTSFPDMWEGEGKQPPLSDLLHFFPSVVTHIEEKLEDRRCKTAGMV